MIELAIVIIIIGLLVVGVITGEKIIQQSKNRATLLFLNRIDSAVATFKVAYNSIPGDISDADVEIPSVGNANHVSINGSSIGDGYINGENADNAEQYIAWRHLDESETYPNPVTGAMGDDPNTNCVRVPWEAGTCAIFVSSNSSKREKNYKIGLMIGGDIPSATTNPPQAAQFTPKQAKNLDKKIDNGVAHSGKLVAAGVEQNAPKPSEDITGNGYVISDVDNFSFFKPAVGNVVLSRCLAANTATAVQDYNTGSSSDSNIVCGIYYFFADN